MKIFITILIIFILAIVIDFMLDIHEQLKGFYIEFIIGFTALFFVVYSLI